MASSSRYCLYHEDKNGFSLIQKELQKCGWIPKKCVHRLAMAVCSCRRHTGSISSKEELLEHQAKLCELLEPLRNNFPLTLVTYIDDCLNTATVTDYSHCQFLAILHKAKLGDFSMLSRATLSSNSKMSEKDLQREINRNRKLTPHQIEIIKNKKKKKMDTCIVKLPVFPGNFLKLKLDFVKEIKGLIEPQAALNNENFEAKKIGTFVKVWGNPSNIKSLRHRLMEEAKAVQKRMDDERTARQERRKQQRRNRAYLQDDLNDVDYEETVMTGHVKELLTDDFSLKVQKSSRGRSKAVQVKAQTSVLDGGHCLQCFKLFTDLHDNTACTFHEGYTVTQLGVRIWSCCAQKMEDDTDIHTTHNSTGCSTSRVHNWRTQARSQGKHAKPITHDDVRHYKDGSNFFHMPLKIKPNSY